MRDNDDKKNMHSEIKEQVVKSNKSENLAKHTDNHEDKEKSNKNEKLIKVLTVAALLFIVLGAIFIAFIFNSGENNNSTGEESASLSQSKTIRINEYVISNASTLIDEEYDSPDWIEIYNYGDESVWLGDVYLSDSIREPEKFLLPDITIMPNDYLLVLASGKDMDESSYVHASFKLGEDDNEILLFCNKEIIDKLEIEQVPQDISAGYSISNTFGYFAEPTPGAENSTEAYEQYDINGINKYAGMLIINEYVSNNDFGITNSYNENTDWIEIYNPNDSAVFLGDYYLSDDANDFYKYKLPEIELESYGYIIVYAAGADAVLQDELTAPFSISSNDDVIILSYKNGQQVDSVEVFDLTTDISAGLDNNGDIGFFSIPTPASQNSTEASDTMDISPIYPVSSPLVINEWMSNNEFGIVDADGELSDWVEIYNPTDESIALDGYALTDDIAEPKKWIFPTGTIIQPYSYVLVYMSGKDTITSDQLHANFHLGQDDTLYLIAPSAGVIESVAMEYLPGNVSKGRTEIGYGYFYLPTPNSSNSSSYVSTIKQGITFLHSDLYISEVSPSKISSSRSGGKYTYEFIELYNSGEEAINLAGYSLCEDNGDIFAFEDVTINPNAYLVVSVKGYIKKELNYVRAENLSLSSAGERLFLKNNDGMTIDCFDTGYLLGDYSSGRTLDDSDTRVFFATKTPGEVNSSVAYTSYSTKPSFSRDGGMVEDEEFSLTITADDNSVIYYTLDGSIPSEDSLTSKIYTEPIKINSDEIVRAISISDGKLPSLCMSATYILERTHDIPIVCLSSEPDGLFSSARGIYADGYNHDVGIYPFWESNYYWNAERLVSFEYYLEDGSIGVAFDGGIQIAGAYSRALPQKSLVIRLRDEYGLSEVDYPFFDEGCTTFKHILLRNSGQDHFMTKMRDAYILNCASELGTVDCKRANPVAVYINGTYWGFYNMRDKLNKDYLALKYGYDDDVTIHHLTHYSSPKSGDNEDWYDLKDFCYSTDFNIKENYDKLGERVDIDAFIDYWIVQMVFSNRDSHNIDFWKAEVEGSKWRPILFDMDLALLPNDVNVVAMHLGNGNLGYHDFIKDALVSSKYFEEQFLERFSYVLANIYTEEYLISSLYAYKEEIQNEMVYHIERWPYPKSYEKWESYVEIMKDEVINRLYEVPLEIQDVFDLTDEEIKELFPFFEKK